MKESFHLKGTKEQFFFQTFWSQCHPVRVYPPKHKLLVLPCEGHLTPIWQSSKDSELVLQVLATTLHTAGLLALVLVVVLACFSTNTLSPHHYEGRCQGMLTHANIYVCVCNILLLWHEDHEASFSLAIEVSVFVFNHNYFLCVGMASMMVPVEKAVPNTRSMSLLCRRSMVALQCIMVPFFGTPDNKLSPFLMDKLSHL